jgi:hypothetical protein
MLQDRVSQASSLAESSRAALALVHQVMFPLNNQPEGLSDLLNCFENGEAIYGFVREHLRCGALVALSFVRIHYPEVDMELLKRLPSTPSGRVDMVAHYSACKGTQITLQGKSSSKAISRGLAAILCWLDLCDTCKTPDCVSVNLLSNDFSLV